MPRIIVTSALPYAYSMPHLGNFVGSVLPADVYFRYLRMKGEDAIFICGSDQHGTPIELAAVRKKMEPEVLADEMHQTPKSAIRRITTALSRTTARRTRRRTRKSSTTFSTSCTRTAT